MKPILHVIFHDQPLKSCKMVANSLKKLFGEDYKLVATTDRVDIIPDNSTIINFNIGSVEQLDGIVEYLKRYSEDYRKEHEHDSSGCEDKMD